MNAVGIVAEFDPFHNGHRYLIEYAKKYADVTVCVMSGNFVQRAVPALLPKRARAESALLGGADIVLELPFVYAVSSAEYFAANAVKILCDFGCNKICFGAENDDRERILKAAEYLLTDEYENALKENLKKNIGFATARQKAFDESGIDFDISQPNNILAVEYAKEIIKNYPDVEILPLKRNSVSHDSDQTQGEFASASLIRERFLNDESYREFVPESAFKIYSECRQTGSYADFDRFTLAVLSKLRNGYTEQDGKLNAFMTDELYARMKKHLLSSKSLLELYENMKVKHYAHSRIRRAILCEFFEITGEDIETPPAYIRVTGFRKEKENEFRLLAKSAALPVVTSASDIEKLGSPEAKRLFEIEAKSTDIYSLCLNKPKECSLEYSSPIIKI